MEVQYVVSGQHIHRLNDCEPVADSRNYLYATFLFETDEWQGHVKTAIFQHNGDEPISVILTNDRCKVPHECIKAGIISTSVFCGDLVTTDKALLRITESGYCEGKTPAEPTPDVYSQIIKMIEEIEVQGVTDEQLEKAITKYFEAHPIETLTEEDVQRIVSEYVATHKDELKGDKGDTGQNGADGYTPQKGVDYWTAEDITEIQLYIDTQIGGALNGSY